MARCDVCGKGPMSGNNVSHSHLKTKRKWQPNVKRMRVKIDNKIKKTNVCTACLRSGKVVKVV